MTHQETKLYLKIILQHADHFARIIEDKNKNQNQSKPDLIKSNER